MKQRGWLTPILVFIICIFFLLSYQSKQGGASLAFSIDNSLSLWNTDISNIKQIEYKEANTTVTAQLTETGWELMTPSSMKVDATYIYNILSSFSNPQVITVITTDTSDLAPYGIDKFSKSLTLYDTHNNKYELISGKEASASTYYVYSPTTKAVYTMHKEAFDYLSHNLTLWRDKDYLHFNADTTSQVKLQTQTDNYVLTASKHNGITEFTSSELSTSQIDSIINFLKATRITTFIVDDASDNVIQNYGFNNPEFRISIISTSGEVTTINLNTSSEYPDQSYIMLNNQKSIFAVSSFNFNATKSKN